MISISCLNNKYTFLYQLSITNSGPPRRYWTFFPLVTLGFIPSLHLTRFQSSIFTKKFTRHQMAYQLEEVDAHLKSWDFLTFLSILSLRVTLILFAIPQRTQSQSFLMKMGPKENQSCLFKIGYNTWHMKSNNLLSRLNRHTKCWISPQRRADFYENLDFSS